MKSQINQVCDFGILYVATGDSYFEEACINARFIHRILPHVPISICTDRKRSIVDSPFQYVDILASPTFNYRDKISGLISFQRYSKVLFLDCDALIIHSGEIGELSELLDIFDLAACPAPVSHPPGWQSNTVPRYFHEYNTGVLLFKRTSSVQLLLLDWLSNYDSLYNHYNQQWDQASFRLSLWSFHSENQIRFFHLPIEYNLRTTKPWTASRGSYVSILHGRFDYGELQKFIHYLNSDADCFRTWYHWLKNNPGSSICPKYDRTSYLIS